MRIAYCIHSLNQAGGMERVLTVKANDLAARRGHEVTIITARQKGRKIFFPLDPAVRLIDLGANDRFGPLRFRYRSRLRKHLREIKPDITISLSDGSIFALPKMDDGSVKIAEFHFSHDKYLSKYGRSAIGRLYAEFRIRKLERAAEKMAAFVVLTRADLSVWKQRVKQAVQIYNPLTFIPSGMADTDCKRVLAVGRLAPQKNFANLIEAWKAVADRHPDWTLDIFGEGKSRSFLAGKIREYELERSVRLRGNTSDIGAEMQRSGFLVMSSRFEGFPLVLAEAAAAGLPLVSYDCPCGPSEMIRDGWNGFLVPLDDTAGLAAAVCRMIESLDRRLFGKRSAEIAAKLNIGTIMTQWEELFHRLVQEQGREYPGD